MTFVVFSVSLGLFESDSWLTTQKKIRKKSKEENCVFLASGVKSEKASFLNEKDVIYI